MWRYFGRVSAAHNNKRSFVLLGEAIFDEKTGKSFQQVIYAKIISTILISRNLEQKKHFLNKIFVIKFSYE